MSPGPQESVATTDCTTILWATAQAGAGFLHGGAYREGYPGWENVGTF